MFSKDLINRLMEPMPTNTSDERWLSVEEIADHLGVTKDSIYRWIERRGLPAHRVGKLWKFMRSEVDAWVRSGKAVENSGDGKLE